MHWTSRLRDSISSAVLRRLYSSLSKISKITETTSWFLLRPSLAPLSIDSADSADDSEDCSDGLFLAADESMAVIRLIISPTISTEKVGLDSLADKSTMDAH